MVKPLVGDIVVLPFPHTDLQVGKRRPALVVADLAGDDLILCQITSRSHHRDPYSIRLTTDDFDKGGLKLDSYVRSNRLFTVDHSVILYVVGKIKAPKLKETQTKIRELFGP